MLRRLARMLRMRKRPPSGVQDLSRGFLKGPAPLNGFHDDRHILALADFFLKQSQAFVETGTHVGTTALYVGTHYNIPVFSCEPSPEFYACAVERCAGRANIHLAHQQSPEFLYGLFERHPEMVEQRLTFWLDAHGPGFDWPLIEEVRFITSTMKQSFMMIDDFRVPGRPEFGCDEYAGQVCEIEFIRPGLAHREYRMILPTFTEHTSAMHPLRGVGAFVFGLESFSMPGGLRESFSVEVLRPETQA